MQARAPIENEKKKLRSLNEWSTPERRIGSRELPLIPNEIYLDIIDYFHPLDELGPGECRVVWRSLGLVCRFFYSVTFPRLFRSLVFSPSKTSLSQPDMFTFLRELELEEQPALSLGPHVKECIIRNWEIFSKEKRSRTEASYTLFIKAVVRMESLTTLSLNKTLMTSDLLQAIGKLQQLKSLKIDECPFRCIYIQDIECLSSLRLTTFHLFRTELPLRWFEPLLAHLEELRTDEWGIWSLEADRENLRLRVLEVNVDTDFSVLSSVLAKTPMLSDLHLECGYAILEEEDEEFVPTPIPASLISNLRRFYCHPRLFQYFPCSNLLEVHLNDPAILEPDAFIHLPMRFRISPHVRTLHVPGYLLSADVAMPVSVYFPNVEHLTINIRDDCDVDDFELPELKDEFSERMCSLLKARNVPMRTLRELDIDVKVVELLNLFMDLCFDLPYQRQMIANLEHHGFTSLVGLSFLCLISWRRLGSDEWEPFVHYKHRKRVKLMLKNRKFKVVDPYGCLGSVPQSEAE